MVDFKVKSFIIALADITQDKINKGELHFDRLAWDKVEDKPGEIWWNDAKMFHDLEEKFGDKYGVTPEEIIEEPDLQVEPTPENPCAIGFKSNAFNHPQTLLSRRIAQAELLVSVIIKSIHVQYIRNETIWRRDGV